MAVGNVAIKIDIKGAYSGQAAVTKAQRDMKGLQSSATEATVSFGKLGSTVKNALGGFLAVQGIQAAATALYDAAKAGAATNDQLAVLNAQGVNTSKILAEAGRAAGGLIPEADLARGLATYKAFGLDIEQFAATVGQSVRTAVRTGQDATFLFDSLVTGIARGSTAILDNLGIILKVSDVNEEFTRTTGLSADAMTAQQKQAMTLKLALEQLSGANAAVNLETGSQVAEIRRLEVAYDDLKSAIGRNLAEDISSNLRVLRTGELAKVSGQTLNWRDSLRTLYNEGPAGFLALSRQTGRAAAAFEIARATGERRSTREEKIRDI